MANRRKIRRWLDCLLSTDAELEAFVIDYFPRVKKRFGSSMDRIVKTNLLLEVGDLGYIIDALIEHTQQEDIRRTSEQDLCIQEIKAEIAKGSIGPSASERQHRFPVLLKLLIMVTGLLFSVFVVVILLNKHSASTQITSPDSFLSFYKRPRFYSIPKAQEKSPAMNVRRTSIPDRGNWTLDCVFPIQIREHSARFQRCISEMEQSLQENQHQLPERFVMKFTHIGRLIVEMAPKNVYLTLFPDCIKTIDLSIRSAYIECSTLRR